MDCKLSTTYMRLILQIDGNLQPPTSPNLIIAVSFGLFVPARILNNAKYGGLNLHPSLLPEYVSASVHSLPCLASQANIARL